MVGQSGLILTLELADAIKYIVIPPDNTTRQLVHITDGPMGNCLYARLSDGSFVKETCSGGSNSCLIDVTYAQLIALIGANGLMAGCFYRINDFQTVHVIPNTEIIHTGTIEPLIVQANTTNSIHAEAISTIFDGAELLYEIVDSTTSGGTKGRIYYRWDTHENNITWYDWRSVIFRRWDDGTGKFTSLTDNGNEFQDYFTFNEIYIGQPFASAPFCFGNNILEITDLGMLAFGAPTDRLNNLVFNDIAYNNVFYHDCFNSTLGFGGGDPIAGNVVLPGFFNNTIGDNFTDNTIHIIFNSNSIGSRFNTNVILASCSNNDIGDNFANNTVGDKMQFNTIGDDFVENLIGGNLLNNVIANNFFGNVIGNSFFGNFILDSFQRNRIGNDFTNNGTALNPIAISFVDNKIGNNFGNNISGTSFQDNVIGDTFFGNTIGDVFKSNIIGNFIQNNIIGTGAITNFIDDFFHDNIIGNNFLANAIQNDFNNNIIDTDAFQNNNIGRLFEFNKIRGQFIGNAIGNNFGGQFTPNDINFTTLGDGFNNNEIFNDFRSNIVGQVGQTFQLNHIETGLIGVDFTLSTHVYGTYTAEIILNSAGTYRLRYTDGADTIIYTSPNA